MSHKSALSMLSLLTAVAAVILMGFSPARQAWLINAWSLQYTHHTLNPAAQQSVALPDPPAGHARAKFWQAKAALHLRGQPGPGRDADRFAGRTGRTVGMFRHSLWSQHDAFSRNLEIWWAKLRGKPNPMLRIGEKDHGNRDGLAGEELWALRGVSFTIEQGEVISIPLLRSHCHDTLSGG